MVDLSPLLLQFDLRSIFYTKSPSLLQVPDEILIDRCVGRKLDPLTGKIYHVTHFPPETEDIKARLITRPDDTEEKVLLTPTLLRNAYIYKPFLCFCYSRHHNID